MTTSKLIEILSYSVPIGIGATLVADLWAIVAKHALGLTPPNWALVGRWFGHFPRGRFVHTSIAAAPPVRGERAIGWTAHYAIGIAFATLLLLVCGADWALAPSFFPALAVGVATVAAPFLLMQPGMGLGVAASKTPHPNAARVRSLVAHAMFGVGLYLAALALAPLFRG